MKHKVSEISPKFVEYIPERLAEGELYISERFRIATHLCCCGCGQEVVTPLTPVEWRVVSNGGKVSLQPSIGNWSFPCKSHYWIKNNRVQWAAAFNARQIAFVQQKDKQDKDRYIATLNAKKEGERAMHEDYVGYSKGILHSILELFKKLFRG